MSNISYFAIKALSFQKIKEFFIDLQYTVLSPLVSTFIFLIILSTLSHQHNLFIKNITYEEFVIPGIILMIVMQVSYQNISESLIHMKQIGSFNDYLISPMSRVEILTSMLIASVSIGIFLGFLNTIIISFFFQIKIINYFLFFYYIFLTSLLFSLVGSIIGFLSYTWDTQQSFFNFIIIPISFLSGTFFYFDNINQDWQFLFTYNPFFYLVDNFRNTFYEISDFNIFHEVILIMLIFIILFFSIHIYKYGYKVIN